MLRNRRTIFESVPQHLVKMWSKVSAFWKDVVTIYSLLCKINSKKKSGKRSKTVPEQLSWRVSLLTAGGWNKGIFKVSFNHSGTLWFPSWSPFSLNCCWHQDTELSTWSKLNLKWEFEQCQHPEKLCHQNPETLKLPQHHRFSPERFLDTCRASHSFNWTDLIN